MSDDLKIKPCSICHEDVAWDDTEPVVCNECQVDILKRRAGCLALEVIEQAKRDVVRAERAEATLRDVEEANRVLKDEFKRMRGRAEKAEGELATMGWHRGHLWDCIENGIEKCPICQRLAEAEGDRELMDWLEEQLNKWRYHADFAIQSDEEDGVWFARITRHDSGILQGLAYDDAKSETVRAAIRAARRGEKKNG